MRSAVTLRPGMPLVAAALLAASSACVEKAGEPPLSQGTVLEQTPAAVASATGSASPAPLAPPPQAAAPAWTEAVRFERWTEAAALLDALSPAELARPEMRYVRARVAVALGDGARAIPLLSGLENDLPLVATDIARFRAEAQLASGDTAAAGAYFAQSKRALDLVRGSQAYARAGDTKQARLLAAQALAAAQRGRDRDDEVAARAQRAALEADGGVPARAAADLRWIATNAPACADGKRALEAVQKSGAPLTPKERLETADALTDAGHPDEALVFLQPLADKPGPLRSQALQARAEALYKSRDYVAAAAAFDIAARTKGKREAEAIYYAARALERSGDDTGALARYRSVGKRFRASDWAERAGYATARLLLQAGRFKEASEEYARYLARFPKGSGRSDAEYEGALARLSSGDAVGARTVLSRLATAASREQAGKLRQLEGLAAARAGDRDGAVVIWTEVARTLPLTWPALAARARLAETGAPLPPLLEPGGAPDTAPLYVKLPAHAALLASVGLDADAERYLAGNESSFTSAYAGRESESLCTMYGMLSSAKRRYRVGSSAVAFPALMRAPSSSEAWAWDCVYPQPYANEVAALEAKNELPRGLIHAIMRQESAFDPAAESPVGALGLLQLMPSTARRVAGEMGTDYDPGALTSPDENLRFGAFYLGKLLRTFKGNVALTAAAYNAGPKAVSRWLAPAVDRDADLWVARIPYGETRTYVARVLGNLARYQWLTGREAAVSELALALPGDARAADDAY